jgi:segregation and condensation protein A
MAATLIYIKSKSLLPQEEITSEDQMLVNDIKDDLIRKIQEFQTYKMLGRKLDELPWSGRDFFSRPVPDPEVIKEMAWAPIDLSSIVTSYQRSLMESRRTMTLLKREYKSISQRVDEIRQLLQDDPNTEFIAQSTQY